MDKINQVLVNECKSFQIYEYASRLYSSYFAPILQIKQNHIDALKDYCQIKSLKNDDDFALSGNFMSDLAFLISHENENIAFYNAMLDEENDEKFKDMLYFFQAQSFNEILPALQSLNSNQFFTQINKTKELFNEATRTFNKLQNKELSQAELEGFLKKLNFSLLGGVLLGVGAMFMFNELTNQNTKD